MPPMSRISEGDLQRSVIDLAMLHHWRVVHVRPGRTATGWRTTYEGHPGLPDLILARNGVVLLAELKPVGGRATAEQQRWLDAAGPHGRLWTPADWPSILTEIGGNPPHGSR